MNTQVSFLDATFSLIHIPLATYPYLLQPILRLLLPQSQFLGGTPPDGAPLDSGLSSDFQHHFLNLSITPLECSIVCHSAWAQSVFVPAILELPGGAAHGVTVSHDKYTVLSIISAGLDAAGRVVELSSPLALAGIPIFFISTYYSDFILTPEKDKKRVTEALLAKGFDLSENQPGFVSPSASLQRRGTGSTTSPPSTPPPSNVNELQARTFDLLKRRKVTAFIERDLELVQCSGREPSQLREGYGLQRPSLSRKATGADQRPAWVDKVDTKLYASIISALVSRPRFMSITLAQQDPPSLLLDRTLLPLFSDSVVGDTEGLQTPILLDFASLPIEITGIVCGVAGRLVQHMNVAESSELSYLSTACGGAVILPENQSARALDILEPLLSEERAS